MADNVDPTARLECLEHARGNGNSPDIFDIAARDGLTRSEPGSGSKSRRRSETCRGTAAASSAASITRLKSSGVVGCIGEFHIDGCEGLVLRDLHKLLLDQFEHGEKTHDQ